MGARWIQFYSSIKATQNCSNYLRESAEQADVIMLRKSSDYRNKMKINVNSRRQNRLIDPAFLKSAKVSKPS